MALSPFPPAVLIKNPDGSVTNTDPLIIATSYFASQAPASIPSFPGLTALYTALNALVNEGILLGSVGVPGTPVLTAGANNGGSPPVPQLSAGSTDIRGTITFGSGSGPAAGAQVVATLGNPTLIPTNANIVVSPSNAATISTTAIGPVGVVKTVAAGFVTAFTFQCATAPAASQANTVYSFDYIVTL